MPKKKIRTGSGRPPKFQEPSTSITLTLPQRILRNLEDIDRDRAKAIVKCVETVLSLGADGDKKVELINISDEAAVLAIGPCLSLKKIPWVHLVEITPSRYLLTVPTGTPMASLEVALLDLIETLPEERSSDRETLLEIRLQLSLHRRQEQVNTREVFLLNPNLDPA
ncbi:MAG: hypothetical protein PHI97_21400 [Desulfobulbus sp.]|nr:hypothetical protein [Desulfobulbus sp.]